MSGFIPDEGESLIADLLLNRDLTNRAAGLELGLFTNVAPDDTITHAAITEPTGTGYARIPLTDGSWTGAGDARTYALRTFTAGAGGWLGSVRGYFVCTTGAAKKLLFVEVDPLGPYTFAVSDEYEVTPNVSVAG